MQDFTNESDWPDDYTHHVNDLGTAIIWILDQSKSEYEQVFVPDVTMKKSQELASSFDTIVDTETFGYRWVPDAVESAAQIVKMKCGGQCTLQVKCRNSACVCIQGRCRRK